MTARLQDHLVRFRQRVLEDALTEATAAYWERRALDFEWARSRPGEPLGTEVTAAQRAANDQHLTQIAESCRHRAQLIRESGLDEDCNLLIAQILGVDTNGAAAA